jgi:hypothetical protein
MSLSSLCMAANAYLFISDKDMSSLLDIEGYTWTHNDIINAVMRWRPEAVGVVDIAGNPVVAQMSLCVMAFAASQEHQRAELVHETMEGT